GTLPLHKRSRVAGARAPDPERLPDAGQAARGAPPRAAARTLPSAGYRYRVLDGRPGASRARLLARPRGGEAPWVLPHRAGDPRVAPPRSRAGRPGRATPRPHAPREGMPAASGPRTESCRHEQSEAWRGESWRIRPRS